MASSRIQPFCRKCKINLGCFDVMRIIPLNNTQRNTALKIHNIRFCLIWKSNDVSSEIVKEDELKPNFKVIDNVISDKHFKSFVEYEYRTKKNRTLTNIVVYDLETLNKNRSVPYCSCVNKLSKISGKYLHDILQHENQNCLNDCVIFNGTDCFNEMLDHVVSFKGEPKKNEKQSC